MMSDVSLIEARFVRRRNRFAADVEVDGAPAIAHVPNSGRMTELLTPGARILLRPFPAPSPSTSPASSLSASAPSPSPGPAFLAPSPATKEGRGERDARPSRRSIPLRRTGYDLLMAWYNGRWAGIDARMPPAAVIAAWRTGLLPALAEYDQVRREVRFAESRLDLLFQGPPGLSYVEAKSVNLVEDGLALFPDAPTTRGARHLDALAEAVRRDHRAAVAFVIQRDDAMALSPHVHADPAFATALTRAIANGVEAYAIVCEPTMQGLVPLRLAPVLV